MIKMLKKIRADIQTVLERDPSAKSWLEVLLCSPGIHALFFYRISHWLYLKKCFLLARLCCQLGRFLTGIEIHPGAQIGEHLFIDHGSGVIIGETTVIGDNVTIFQGVTLGGTGKHKGKRHPDIGNRVLISADAKVLGPIKVGDDAKIGAGAVVIKDVPPNSTVVGVPGRVVVQNGIRVISANELAHQKIPDRFMEIIARLETKINSLENRIAEMEKSEYISELVN